MEVKIRLKITLEKGGIIEFELTMKEAKELAKILNDMTGEPKIIERDVIRDVPTYIPYYPTYPSYPWWYYEPYRITWQYTTRDDSLCLHSNAYTAVSDNIAIGYTAK